MDYSRDRSRRDGFQEIVPWADPYIAALMEKLRRSAEGMRLESEAIGELPPPLDSRDDDHDDPWPHDWSPRNWPRD